MFHHMFAGFQEITNIKLIKDKATGVNAGYGFIEFRTAAAAAQTLTDFNGQNVPGTNKRYRLNWGAHSGGNPSAPSFAPPASSIGGPPVAATPSQPGQEGDFTIFVGDLTSDISDTALLAFFYNRFPSVKGAKIITDPSTGMPKGYGFVKFSDEAEMLRSLTEMQGAYLTTRPIRVSTAKKGTTSGITTVAMVLNSGGSLQLGAGGALPQVAAPLTEYDPNNDSTNTTLYIGNLEMNVTDDQIRFLFSTFGDLVYARVAPGKGCAFVQYMYRQHAEMAMEQLQGMLCGNNRMKIAWGKSTSKTPAVAAVPQAVYGGQYTQYYQQYPGYPYGAPIAAGYGYGYAAPQPVVSATSAAPSAVPMEVSEMTIEMQNREFAHTPSYVESYPVLGALR